MCFWNKKIWKTSAHPFIRWLTLILILTEISKIQNTSNAYKESKSKFEKIGLSSEKLEKIIRSSEASQRVPHPSIFVCQGACLRSLSQTADGRWWIREVRKCRNHSLSFFVDARKKRRCLKSNKKAWRKCVGDSPAKYQQTFLRSFLRMFLYFFSFVHRCLASPMPTTNRRWRHT